MTIQAYFENLLGEINLHIDDEERGLIEKKQDLLRVELRKRLSLTEDFLTGSYSRHTIIKPKDPDEKFDVDLFVVFSADKYRDSELESMRQEVETCLKQIKEDCPQLAITGINTKQRRSVGVEFGQNFQIDVVPAVEVVREQRYKIFDKKSSESVVSNPNLHGVSLTKANDANNGLLVPLIKILKSWKREKCDFVKSYHIELLAVTIFSEKRIVSLPEALPIFFKEAENYLKKPCLKDPANYEMYIDAYLEDVKRQEILSLVRVDCANLQEALEVADEDLRIVLLDATFKINYGDDHDQISFPSSISFTPHKPYAD